MADTKRAAPQGSSVPYAVSVGIHIIGKAYPVHVPFCLLKDQITEYGKGNKHQCRHPDPFVCSQPRDKLSCFHDRTVLIGETCHFLFRGRKPAVRYLCPGNGMTGSVPFSTFGLWKNKFQVKALVKGDHGIE